jgi:TolA-binding protein
MWKFWSAGRIICSRQIFLFLIPVLCFGCGNSKPQQPDPQIVQLQNDVRKLSDDNQQLKQQVETLRQQLTQSQTAISPQNVSQIKPAPIMTVEEMKEGVAPLLKEAIERIKKSSETPKSGNQFGMRMQYDLKHAVYGLVQTGDQTAPYSAKVIVKFEKFLESENSSKSYGNGSSTFLFSYRSGQWVLDSYQNASTPATLNDEQ